MEGKITYVRAWVEGPSLKFEIGIAASISYRYGTSADWLHPGFHCSERPDVLSPGRMPLASIAAEATSFSIYNRAPYKVATTHLRVL